MRKILQIREVELLEQVQQKPASTLIHGERPTLFQSIGITTTRLSTRTARTKELVQLRFAKAFSRGHSVRTGHSAADPPRTRPLAVKVEQPAPTPVLAT